MTRLEAHRRPFRAGLMVYHGQNRLYLQGKTAPMGIGIFSI